MSPAQRSWSCGSTEGHHRHRRLDESPCQRCSDAQALHAARKPWLRAEQPIRYRAALDGREVAEALTPTDRARLVATLHRRGWSDQEIAVHCRMSLFVAAEIRERLGLRRPDVLPAATRSAA